MKIALYENLNKAFEEYNAMQEDGDKLCWHDLLDSIEDKENIEEIIEVINSLKITTEIRRVIQEKQGELSETITRIYNKKMQEKTLRGQCLAGDVKGAIKGYYRIIRKVK